MDNAGVGRFVDCTLSRRAVSVDNAGVGRFVVSWSVVDPSTVRPVWVGLGRNGSERNTQPSGQWSG